MQPTITRRGVRVKRSLTVTFIALAIGAVPVINASAEGFSITWGKTIQGSGKVVEVQRTVPAFDRVVATDGIRLVLRRGNEQKVVIKTDDNIQPLFESQVEGGTLKLRMRANISLRMNSSAIVNIDYTQLNALKLADAASADLDRIKSASFVASAHDGSRLNVGVVEVNEFDLSVVDGSQATIGTVSGATMQHYRVADGARLKIDKAGGERVSISVTDGAQMSLGAIDAKTVEVAVADGARADIAGVALKQVYALTDAASVDAQRLQGTSALVRASDGSSLKLGLVQTLDVDVQDGSSVRYTGDPAITRRARDGSSVRRI